MRRLMTAFLLLTTPAMAQAAPQVVTDIAPIRALTAQIMEGVGTPEQIIPSGASPHGYAMRPSEARALRGADLVIWVGPALTHWLEEPLDTLAGNADRLTLMNVPKTIIMPMREAEDMGADHDHEEEHDHEESGHEKHEDESGHEEHEDEHHHGSLDPHGWLSPSNAVLWSGAIARRLSDIDPENAPIYLRNWEEFRDEVTALEQELTATLAPYSDASFIVLHDAYQYFEEAFDIHAEAFIFAGSGQTPGPATLRGLRAHLDEHPAVCAFTAPQENDALMRTAIEGQGTRIGVLDPIGDGQQSYAALMRSFAAGMATCFKVN